MNLDFSRCRLPPFQHQREDVAWLMERTHAFIASEMRTGKTKIVIDAAQFLFETGAIRNVVVVAPAAVRDVWYDPILGELAKHLWRDLPATVTEYHSCIRTWVHATEGRNDRRLDWYVTNYEFLRRKARLAQLMAACGPRTLLVLDESSFIKNHAAQQTKSCLMLRRQCGRVILLNGTPIFHSPLDLFSQGNILHPLILNCKYITEFKARYAVQEAVLGHGGKPLQNPHGGAIMKISGWTKEGLEDLQRRFAPVTVRRLQAECLDLPPKLDPVALTATLTPTTWRAYKEMRDEMVVWLREGNVATSITAAVKALRLSQITSGFLGGVEDAGVDESREGLLESIKLFGSIPDLLSNVVLSDAEDDGYIAGLKKIGEIEFEANFDERVRGEDLVRDGDPGFLRAHPTGDEEHRPRVATQEIGREKLDKLLEFIAFRLEVDPSLKLVAWCRFRPEVERMVAEVKKAFPQVTTGLIYGGQKPKDRHAALALLHPETAPAGPVFVGGIEGTGSFGLNFTAAHTCVTMSSGYSPGRSAQTLDRVYGPGQTRPIAYYDVVAVGPKGQRTIDHAIIAARRAGENVAQWTAAAWVKALMEE